MLKSWLANHCKLLFFFEWGSGSRWNQEVLLGSCLYDGYWLLALASVGVLCVVRGLSPLECLHRHQGVKTGVDRYDLQTLNIYIFPSIILVLTLGPG